MDEGAHQALIDHYSENEDVSEMPLPSNMDSWRPRWRFPENAAPTYDLSKSYNGSLNSAWPARRSNVHFVAYLGMLVRGTPDEVPPAYFALATRSAGQRALPRGRASESLHSQSANLRPPSHFCSVRPYPTSLSTDACDGATSPSLGRHRSR